MQKAAWNQSGNATKRAVWHECDISRVARPAIGLKASASETPLKSNFPAVPPSTMGNQLNTTENHKEKVNSL